MMPRERYHTRPIEPPVPAPPAPEGRLSVFARTDRGSRERNQDAFLVADLTRGRVGLGPEMTTHAVGDRGSLLAVSDGMGAAGDAAAELVLNTFHRVLGVIPPEMGPSDRLHRAIRHTARHVWDLLRCQPDLDAPSATITAVLVCERDAWVLQIGDSRAYLLRGDRIEQVTKDQTLAEALLDSGAIQPNSRPPDMLLQTLGHMPTVQPVVTRVELHEGDLLLVCSDGLSNALGAEDLLRIAGSTVDTAAACRHLVDAARERSGDNVTVVLARVDAVAHDLDPDEAVTWTMPAVLGE
jgi:protein phosphatase